MNSKTTTISINDRVYDAVTGMPILEKKKTINTVTHQASKTPATTLHSRVQRSVTLHRRAAKKPTPTPQHQVIHTSKHKQLVRTTETHPQVRKFAPHPVGAIKSPQSAHNNAPKMMDIGPVHHPHVIKAHMKSVRRILPKRPESAASIKEKAVKNAIEKTQKRPLLRRRMTPHHKLVGVFSAIIALVLFGGYLTYLNMPNISVRVAAMQAGINAGYPSYNPDGYSLSGPVVYTDGKVSLNYAANGGPHKYTLTQTRSDWNSDAVLDNYVTPKAGANYIPYKERGLVIYMFGNNAAWVNGGILYTIEGNAPLSSEQIRRIATSLL